MRRTFFADAVFYVALLLPRDQHRERAVSFASSVQADDVFVTSEPVLVEVLARLSNGGSPARRRAVGLVDTLYGDSRTIIVPQTSDLFRAGLALYRSRPDKGYSLTDCMSMVICTEHPIEQVLTHDRHFSQEGFEILL